MTCRWRALMQTVFSFSSFTPKALLLLRVGDVLRQSRTFSQQDVQDFSNVTHDRNPIHFDASAACSAGFNCGSVVHGMLVAGIFPCIIASHFPGAVYVSQSLHFKLPVYIGDEVVAEVQTLNLREMKNRYMAKFSTVCYKNGEIVIDGEAIAVLPTLAICRDEAN